MKLFFTDKQFKVYGYSYPNVPFLTDDEMALVEAPNAFLRHVAVVRGRAPSPKTWKAYGNHLYEFFSFLEANNFEWDAINRTHMAVWRDSMLERGCKRSTVNQRLRTVCAFYEWAAREGETELVLIRREDVWAIKPRGFLAHLDVSANRVAANELTVRSYKPSPRFLDTEQAKRFVSALSPRRNRLMAYLMWLVGMRREEVVRLNLNVLLDPAGHPSGQGLRMELDAAVTPTKGNKNRWVLVPYDLAVQLWDYLTFERVKLAALHRRKTGVDTEFLFLTEYGDPISLEGLNNAFTKASVSSGVKCTPHMLRHTYGTHEFLRMCNHKGRDRALHWVRDRLGHSSVRTTEQYIHAADLVSHSELDGYQAEVCQFLRED